MIISVLLDTKLLPHSHLHYSHVLSVAAHVTLKYVFDVTLP